MRFLLIYASEENWLHQTYNPHPMGRMFLLLGLHRKNMQLICHKHSDSEWVRWGWRSRNTAMVASAGLFLILRGIPIVSPFEEPGS
jgi:hypothetical protein